MDVAGAGKLAKWQECALQTNEIMCTSLALANEMVAFGGGACTKIAQKART